MKQPAIIHFRLSSPLGSGGIAIDPEGGAGSCDLTTWGRRPLQESGVKRREKPIPGASDTEGA